MIEFEYINNNPQLLVDVLEVATGVPYEEYLEEKIWSKMAADSGYLWMDREGGTPHGYCCLMALPEDLLRIGLLILNRGELNGEQIIPAEWIDKMTVPSLLNPNYGYLVWLGTDYEPLRKYSQSSDFGVLHSEPFAADDVVYFDGFGGQRVYIVPSQELIIVRVGETRFDFDDAKLPNLVLAAVSSELGQSRYDVGRVDLAWETKHEGATKIRVFYPSGSQGEFPLIVFSHGNFLSGITYDALLKKWAERGYVVIAPTHLDTGEYEVSQEVWGKYGPDWISASRALDLTESIDKIDWIQTQLKDFQGKVIEESVIAAGHSYGAMTAQLLAGATLETQGNSLYPMPESLVDERIAAVIAISPPGIIPNVLSLNTWTSLHAPQFITTGTADVAPPYWTDYRDHLVSYENSLPGDNYLAVFKGVDHYFGNLIGKLDSEAEHQQEALEALVDQSLLFMDAFRNTETSGKSLENLNDFDRFSSDASVHRYERR